MNLASIFAEHRTRNIFFAGCSFLFALIVYTLTVAPTASFWDPAEYIAITHTLQVAHPPGSPFFALFGRVVSMFVPAEHVAFSINMISATASAGTVMLLYLVIIYLIEEFRGRIDNMNKAEQIATYGGALVGALTFMFTHTQWFNAVEAEMYGTSTFFTALVVWVALRWSANFDKPHSERWLILIAYLFGIGIGVHLLNLLALFFVAMIVYFRYYDFGFKSFGILVAASIAIFLSIYPLIIIEIPNFSIAVQNATYGLIGPFIYMALIVGGLIYALYYTHRKGLRIANMILIGYAMILIGYSSYAMVIIRSQAEPPIDENDPSTLTAFISYLSRDQYGQAPLLQGSTFDNRTGNIDRSSETLFPRRHSGQPRHLDYYGNFDNDWQFFWNYQVNHMYLRYFNWNFIGRESDIQDAGWYSGFSDSRHADNPANSAYFYLPFLFGLFGLIYHFRSDWKRGFSVLALFFLTGLAIIFYLNQTPFEPRERDYAYAGSFFAFSIWIGIGASAALQYLNEFLKNKPVATYAGLGLLFLALPVWMGYQNWPSHDRSERYVARDYAYNLLMSVEPNAILFTNGDNDTFPLWYLQEVEGIRTDVRVVVLSLLNTDWYIKQLRDRQTHESRPLPISFTDEEIARFTSEFELFEPRDITIPVDKELLRRAYDDPTQELPGIQRTPLLEHQLHSAVPFSLPLEELDDEVSWFLQGRFAGRDAQGNNRFYLQAQDIAVLNILQNNRWLRPVYFANTVARDGQLGLGDYFQFEGKAFRVVPKERQSGQFGYVDPEVHADRLSNFEFNRWNSPTVYFDENIRRMITNYRWGFMQLADAFVQRGDYEQAAHWLAWGEEKIPFRTVENDWTAAALYAYRYLEARSDAEAVRLAEFVTERYKHSLHYFIEDLDKVEADIASLREQARRARAEGRLDRQQRLNAQTERRVAAQEQAMQRVGEALRDLTILQYVFFESGDIERAEQLAADINRITDSRLPMPETLEESRQDVARYGLGIVRP
ncbi:MAG: protein O-mannosyl-transferase family [Balneolaceae bacterium]